MADPFDTYIAERWKQGCHSAAQIARELRDQGFEGSYYVIRRRVARWREVGPGTQAAVLADRGLSPQPSPRRVASLLLTNAGDLAEDELAFVEALKVGCDIFRVAADLAQQFTTMMRERAASRLDEWFEKARARGASGTSDVRREPDVRRCRRPGGPEPEVEQWSGGGTGESAQDDQTGRCRPSGIRSPAAAQVVCHH